MTQLPYVVAVDLGGTLTKLGRAAPDGALRDIRRVETRREQGSVSVPWLVDLLQQSIAADPQPCAGYAVMAPGIIDSTTQTVRTAANTGWTDLPLGALLDEGLDRPGVIGHDVRAGGLAEWRLGAGVDADNLLFVSLGTGIAAALVVDGRLLEAGGYAGELGHLRVRAAGERRCGCGLRGCLETVSSATGIGRSLVDDPVRRPDAAEVAARARAGEPEALGAFAAATEGLVEAVAVAVALLGPEVVVIGGGLAASADLILPALVSGLDQRLSFHRRPRVLPATLGADAGLIGAGIAGWDQVGRPGETR